MSAMLRPGMTGANAQQQAGANPRDVLLRIVKASPEKTADELFEELEETLSRAEYAPHQSAINRYWFANTLRSIVRPPRQATEGDVIGPGRTEAHLLKLRAKHGDIAKRDASMALLQMIMPNGKALGDCTGQEAVAMGGAIGAIGAAVNPRQTIRESLTEEEARATYDAAVESLR